MNYAKNTKILKMNYLQTQHYRFEPVYLYEYATKTVRNRTVPAILRLLTSNF